ncbi:1-acyl-sn-glycerol-3-phosphate acyltransferase [Dactylosporangium roseum]|uniref:1-acyl-sn-glycerol-3-phosphate acyltransferase n=1 Tax=Dactylosporangium roseum TaxID=47989 RepID=A0ABY5YWJ1_9ACTN|nr:lysophospholipid acyltransferase family protein [Dactylosporangium roseum]UWZ33622.1 1-acyl-sn-glycerol-3-phosphate acyltransferase [Dactylosporangium roseum]
MTPVPPVPGVPTALAEPARAAGIGGPDGAAGAAGPVPAVSVVSWRVPRVWRVLLFLARLVVVPIARLRVTGDVPAELRAGPVIFAVNHIGPFDPIAVTAACRVMRVAPRLMATGGLFRAPVVGSVMRAAGHIRINRRQANVVEAVDDVAGALGAGSHIMGYPEGRITLDPGMWPERGKTGMARIALRTGVPVVAVAQWGAHEVAAWGGFGPTVRTVCRSLVRRPVVRVHFGGVVDLSGVDPAAPGAAQRVTDRIIDAITAELRPLRVDEPRLPRWVDPIRPLSTQRRHVSRRPV